MSKILDKFKTWFSIQDEYDEDDDDIQDEPREKEYLSRNIHTSSSMYQSKVVPLSQSNSKMEILSFTMLSYDMTEEVASYIKAKKPIIVNMEKLDKFQMLRTVDFLTGACYALNGSVEKITENIFIFAPEHVNINPDKIRQKTILPQV